jgi:ParB family chromosome partitioning protein
MITEAADTLVTSGGRFRHSFELALDSITADPSQPRQHFDDTDIMALAGTMRDQGQLQPILVRRDPQARHRWTIVAGERRFRAALLLGWPAILAIEHTGDPEVTALIENLQRVDLSPVEEARGLQRLIGQKEWSQDRAAAALGRAKSDISATLGILSLPSDLLDAVLTSELPLSKNVLAELARVEPGPIRDDLIARAKEGELTVRAIRQARMALEQAKVAFRFPHSPPPQPAPVARAHPKLFPVARIGKLTAALEQAQEGGIPLDKPTRAALEQLRTAIDAMLATGF